MTVRSCVRRPLRPVLAGVLAASALSVTAAPAQATPDRVDVVSVFPTNDLTVRDRRQLTGVRVDLPTRGCGPVVQCGLVRGLNELDGFDLDPRMALRFDGPVDPAAVAAAWTVEQRGGGRDGQDTGVDRVVYDAATSTVYAHPAEQLRPGTTYRLRLRGQGLPRVREDFTTLSATDGLLDLRAQIDSGRAFTQAGIDPTGRGLQVDAVVPAAGTVLSYTSDLGSGTSGPAVVPNASVTQAGSYVFGSYLAPSWLRPDRTIEQTPTGNRGPRPVGTQRLPFVLIVPSGTAPAGGWPVAVFGHGFTRTDGDLFLAAATNAGQGLATIATHVVGHGSGPGATWTLDPLVGGTLTVQAYGRGVDLDGNGTIDSTEGSSTLAGSPVAAVSSRDGLRQTAADLMTLVRAVGGADVDSDGRADLSGADVTYYGQSFGGIYGTMLAGADPTVARSVLNVPGGPITEIARLSPAFRPLTAQALFFAGLLNGGDDGFTESLPLRDDPPVLAPAPGALAIQAYLADSSWLARAGGPETFAPLLRADRTLFQVARGDQTVPNPTSFTLIDAGGLFARTALYRNDLSARAASNPHGFLLDPSFAQAFLPGQVQASTFLRSGQTVDPDGPGPVWETPVRDPALLRTLGF